MSSDAAKYFAEQLERLMALPLSNKAEAEIWYSECSKVQTALEEKFPDFEPEHEAWHFFNDADIRARQRLQRLSTSVDVSLCEASSRCLIAPNPNGIQIHQPRVARHALPWDNRHKNSSTTTWLHHLNNADATRSG